MTMRRVFLHAIGVWILAFAPVRASLAGDTNQQDPDWPCEQALVPEVSAAVVWDGPSIDVLGQGWRSVPGVEDLVRQLTAPNSSPEAAGAAIDAFASELESPGKDRVLTGLFAGVLETLNDERSMLIDGIKRYSRDQGRRAEALGDKLNEMVRLEQDTSDAARAQLEALTKTLEIEQRVFDEREKSIEFLCTRPIAVEQRLGFLAREIAAHLD